MWLIDVIFSLKLIVWSFCITNINPSFYFEWPPESNMSNQSFLGGSQGNVNGGMSSPMGCMHRPETHVSL